MSLAVAITRDEASPALRRLIDGLADRTRLNQSIARRAETLTRRHLSALSRSRHDTARRLGARPTGHLGRAAENVTSAGDANAATVSVTSPGIARVARDLSIRPVNSAWLTIPIHRLAYGRTAREVSSRLRSPLFRPGPPGRRRNVLSAVVDGRLTHFYAMSRGVTQKQDRALLPSDSEYLSAANRGARDFVQLLRRRRQ